MPFHGATGRVPISLNTLTILSFGFDGPDISSENFDSSNGILFGTASTPAAQADIEACMPFQVAAFLTNAIQTSISNWSFIAVDPTNGSRIVNSISDLNTVTYGGKVFYCVFFTPQTSIGTRHRACAVSNQVSAVNKVFYVFYDA